MAGYSRFVRASRTIRALSCLVGRQRVEPLRQRRKRGDRLLGARPSRAARDGLAGARRVEDGTRKVFHWKIGTVDAPALPEQLGGCLAYLFGVGKLRPRALGTSF